MKTFIAEALSTVCDSAQLLRPVTSHIRHNRRLRGAPRQASLLVAALGYLFVTATAGAAAPLPRAGLIMHLESREGIHASGNSVQYWWDQSGHGQDMRSNGQPRLIHNVLNGRPVIELDSANDKLRQFRPSSLPIYGNDRTVFVLSAPINGRARIGYGESDCNRRFLLQHEPDGYSGMSTGCAKSLMHAQESLASGQWRLNTAILERGTFFHLRDGVLVDGRTRTFDTRSGPFIVELTDTETQGSQPKLQIAAILVYNWALGVSDLRKVHRYLGETYFRNGNRFGQPSALSSEKFPSPQMTLTKTVKAQNELQLDWRVSFADECGATNGWSRSSATSGSELIRTFNTGGNYALNCWHRRASANASFDVDLRPLRISWWPAENQAVTTGYKLFVGNRSESYDQVVELPKSSDNSHTLQIAPGTYYVAMSTLGRKGRESGLSQEIKVRVR